MPRPIWYDTVPNGFWDRSENRRAFLEWLERKLNLRDPEDWYSVSMRTIERYGGAGLKRYYRSSMMSLVEDYMPSYDWKEWLFPRVSKGFWDDRTNRMRYLEWLAKALGFEKVEDWYGLHCRHLTERGGSGLLGRFNSSRVQILRSHFPEHEWLEWRFQNVPMGFWDDSSNVRRYLDWLGDQLGFKEPKDWYALKARHLDWHFGTCLRAKCGGAPSRIMQRYFPEHEWLEWQFHEVPKGFWTEVGNVRRYLEWLGAGLGFRQPEDWYRLKKSNLMNNHGSSLLVLFRGSLFKLVRTCFPEHEWLEWRFRRVSVGFWENLDNARRYLAWLGDKMGFEEPEDWYRLSSRELRRNHGATLLKRFNSFVQVIRACYPEHDWQEWRFHQTPQGFWEDQPNVRRYLEWLGRELGFEKQEDWYRLTIQKLNKHYGFSLGKKYRYSIPNLLRSAFPEIEWTDKMF